MAFLGIKKAKNEASEQKNEKPLSFGRVAFIPTNLQTVRPTTTAITDILTSIVQSTNKYATMDILVDSTPFGRMALNIYSTLTNVKGQYKFYNPNTRKQTKRNRIEEEWNAFYTRRWGNTDSGLDGVFDALTRSLYTRGDMALEIVVAEGGNDIAAIYVIDPSTFSTFQWMDAENRYAIYQSRTDGKTIDLYQGNFLRFPYQPNINNPVGTLPFEAAIQASIDYYQHKLDATTVLNRIGYPRYMNTIDSESVLAMARPTEKDTFEKRDKLLSDAFDAVENSLRGFNRDSDVITFDYNKLEILGGGVNGNGIDVRAWFENDTLELADAYGLPRIYMNMEKGGSYALGTAEMQSLIMRIENSGNDIVSIKEAIGNMFCRVYGFNAICKFTPNPIEWQKLVDKYDAELKHLELEKRKEEYGYISQDDAANTMTGNDTAADPLGAKRFVYIKSFQDESSSNASSQSDGAQTQEPEGVSEQNEKA